MPLRTWLSRSAVALGAVVVVVGAVLVVLRVQHRPAAHHYAQVAADRRVTIPVGDGVGLAAEVVRPRGDGRFPLVILPTSLGSQLTEYHGLVLELAANGYEAVTYVQRGFRPSGGEIDLAGPETQQDVSRVIDWALAHEPADAARIGAFGTSYGASVSLLAAARDARIKAVVATSGWGDLAAALVPNGTGSAYALPTLLDNAARTGRLDAEVTRLRDRAKADPAAAAEQVGAMSPSRSPVDVVGALNRHHTAVMLASGYQDAVLLPSSLIPFFQRLTAPKRLQLTIGGHGQPEAGGLAGQPNETVSAGQAWLDHFVKGDANGVQDQAPVQLTDAASLVTATLNTWPAKPAALNLGRPGPSGDLGRPTPAAWSARIEAGVDSAATSNADTVDLTAIDPKHAAMWTSDTGRFGTFVAGQPELTLTASASTGAATLVAYLYDVGTDRHGALVAAMPFTLRDARQPRKITITMPPMARTFVAGHQVALIIDTVDPRWHSASTNGSVVTLRSTASEPAQLSAVARRVDG